MPRGGYRGNNSPFSDENAITATPAELSALTANAKEIFIKSMDEKPVDLHNQEDVKRAIIGYFEDCERSGKRPGNMGLYRALGMTRQDVHAVLTGKVKNKVSPDCIDTIKKAVQILSEYREQLGSVGKLNPVTLIFWQKNFDGLQDTARLEVAATDDRERKTPEEIAKQIEKDIPIDAEFTEKD